MSDEDKIVGGEAPGRAKLPPELAELIQPMIQQAARQEVAQARTLSEQMSRKERETQLRDERRFLRGLIPVVEQRHKLSEDELRVMKTRLSKVEDELSTLTTPRTRAERS